jgi:hypothetical protein
MRTAWRSATIADYPSIQQCHHRIEEKLGEEMDLPAFAHPAILAWLVAERDGEIVQFAALERLVEFRMGGCDREAMQELLKTMGPDILRDTKAAGIRFIHICVPPTVEKQVARKLKKLKIERSPNSFYVADLR